MRSPSPRAASLLGVLAGVLLTASLLAVTTLSAWRAYGTSFPSLFVDPFGGFSAVRYPTWDTAGVDISIGESVAPAHGPRGSSPGERLMRAADEAARHGDTMLPVVIGAEPHARTVSIPLRRIGSGEILWFYGLYVLAGLLLLWSGVAVGVVARHQPGGRAYVGLALVAFVFLATFLDYHTTRWVAPLFAASTLGNSVALFALAWWFPEAPQVGPPLRRAAYVVLAAGVACSLVLGLAAAFAVDLRSLRAFSDLVVPAAFVAPIVSVLWRLFGRGDRGRPELRSAATALLVVPVALVVTFFCLYVAGELSVFSMALPFVSFAVPGAIGTALIRHNALAVRAVVTRRLMTVPIVLISLVVGAGFSAPLWATERWLVAVGVGVTVASAVGVLGWVGAGRLVSTASSTLAPALEGLASEVFALRTPDAIRTRLGELVQRCLPTREVRTVSAPELTRIRLGSADQTRFAAGETVWTLTSEEFPLPALAAPLHFGDAALGAILVTARAGDPLFSDGEARVIQTLVSLGALALHHAELLGEVEKRRAIEVAATQADKRLSVDVVAAEIAHELTYPISFFRHVLKQVTAGRASPDTVEVGRDEVERLERMLAWVRKLQVPAPSVAPVRVRVVIARVLVLLESELETRGLACSVDVPDELTVIADPDALLQLLANLLRNASQAARARVGVRTVAKEHGDTELQVWDDGPGVPPELAPRIFDPLFSTQTEGEGHGLGLAVAQRVANGFGWTIAVRRDGEETVFAVTMKQRAERKAIRAERVAS